MNDLLEMAIDELMEDKYSDYLDQQILTRANRIDIDFQDLTDEAKEVLNDNYIAQRYGILGSDVITAAVVNSRARQLGITNFYDEGEISLHYYNVSPKLKLRDVSASNMNGLFQLNGTVISVTPPMAFMKKAVYECTNEMCRLVYSIEQATPTLTKPEKCQCGGSKFILLPNKCIYDDYQEIILQENPEEVTTGVVLT